MFSTYEVQLEAPNGRSMYMLVAAPNAHEAVLTARDMLLEFADGAADREYIYAAMREATVYEVSVQRIQTAA